MLGKGVGCGGGGGGGSGGDTEVDKHPNRATQDHVGSSQPQPKFPQAGLTD